MSAPLPSRIPQPRPLPLIGNAGLIDPESPVKSFMALAEKWGPLFRLQVVNRTVLVVSSSELVHELCDETRFDKYIHGPLEILRNVAGDALFTAHTHEENWGLAHRILLPAFGAQAMRGYFEAMHDIAEQMLLKWERLGPTQEFDVPDNMTRLTLDTIALCGFGKRLNSFYRSDMHPFIDAMVRALEESGLRTKRLPIQTKLLFKAQRQYETDIAAMNEVVDEVIRERRAELAKMESGEKSPSELPRDLLSLMLTAKDPQSGKMLSDINIRQQVVTFLIAGHETTSGLLSFAVHLMLENPETLRKATEEVDRVLGRDPRVKPRFEQLAKLTYLDQVLRETLRIWPTAPAFAVSAREDTTLAGVHPLTPKDPLLVLTPQLHRDPTVWPEPERFDPERFAPERIGQIPPHAWKPFGNGQRACIGRQFAMQEAVLVLAMMLQRFELERPRPYTLEVKETLTLKPHGLSIRVKSRPRVEAPTSLAPIELDVAARSRKAPVAVHGTPMRVYFGSNSGSAEALARQFAGDAGAAGWKVDVAPLDAAIETLKGPGAVVVFTASYNGKPPDNARAFCEWLPSLPETALEGVQFAVFGCGHKDWAATYQAIPRQLDAGIAAKGAKRLFDLGEGDARGDFFGAFDSWTTAFWPKLSEAFALESPGQPTGARYQVEVAKASRTQLDEAQGAVRATVVENRELVDMSSPFGRSKRHVVLQLPEGVIYAAGDHLAVSPENDAELVARVAKRFGFETSDVVTLRSLRGGGILPVDAPMTVGELLGQHLELTAPATRRDLEALARYTECPPHKAKLLALRGESDADLMFQSEVVNKRLSATELLLRYEACAIPFAEFLELLNPLKPRRYSIASSPAKDARQCALTVSVVDGPAWSGEGRFRGTASGFLQGLPVGATVSVVIHPHAFRLPEQPTTPVVMVAAGSGLAPFRGFLEERATRKANGEALGPALLFFGCDHPDVDFLYRDELAAWERAGVAKVLPAFCRDEKDGVTFVQHRLWNARAEVLALLQDGGVFYLCGDGRHMAPAVRAALTKLLEEGAGTGGPTFAELENQGRYRTDIFGS